MRMSSLSIFSALCTFACATPEMDNTSEDITSSHPSQDDETDDDDDQPETESDADADADSDADADADADSDAEPEYVFEPSVGTWIVIASELTRDDCGLEDAVDRGEPGTTLNLSGSDSDFTMIFEAGERVVCSATDELEFDCDPTETIDSTATDMGLDADIPVVIHTYGSFEDETNMWMESIVEIDCEGSACGLVQILLGTSFPCTMAMASELQAN